MKTINFVLLIAAMAVTSFSFSQNSTSFEYHHFLVDGEYYYQVIADVHTTYGFYSKDNGGHLLRLVEVNGKENTFKDFVNFPAMVVCLDKERREGIYGFVRHTDQPLFHFSSYQMYSSGSEIQLQWKLEELNSNDLYMEVQIRDASGHFKTVRTIEAIKGQRSYTFEDARSNKIIGYRVMVKSESNGAYYASKELKIDPELWQLFPVPATDHLQIINIPDAGTYSIIDLKGSLVKSGNLQKHNSKVDLSSVPAGSYLIRFNAGSQVQMRKFVKE